MNALQLFVNGEPFGAARPSWLDMEAAIRRDTKAGHLRANAELVVRGVLDEQAVERRMLATAVPALRLPQAEAFTAPLPRHPSGPVFGKRTTAPKRGWFTLR